MGGAATENSWQTNSGHKGKRALTGLRPSNTVGGGFVDYSSYTFSAKTQADFFKAEAEVLRFGGRVAQSPYAKHMKTTLMAIDAVFAVRMSHDIELASVPLIVAFDLTDWKYHGDAARSLRPHLSEFQFSEESCDAALEALHYMQALEWVEENAKPGFTATIDTIQHLHEILLNGKTSERRYYGFRNSYLPHKKGADPSLIPVELNDLCQFCNSDFFSPLGQASVIHHAFESIVPFDSMIDRTGLLFAFMPMFRRGLFVNGYMAPICWGASLEKEYRRKLKDSSREESSSKTHLYYREQWAAYNARNTHMAVVIADSFLSKADKLRAKWRSQGLKIPSRSAIDKLLDLFLAVPCLSTRRASAVIGKSYGATNEAMNQLAKAKIVKEAAIDSRERAFICEQSASMITEFVDELVKMSKIADAADF